MLRFSTHLEAGGGTGPGGSPGGGGGGLTGYSYCSYSLAAHFRPEARRLRG